jgi:uncharacterized protein
LLSTLVPLLAFAYVAALVLVRETAPAKTLIRLLAPAGRIALTLYISESVLMAVLLNGFGLGLGATFGQFALFVTAVAVYCALLTVAHVMQKLAIPAPLEILWRRYTNAVSATGKSKQ